MEHNAEELQEILNRIMQGIVSIITSALDYTIAWDALNFTHAAISYAHAIDFLQFTIWEIFNFAVDSNKFVQLFTQCLTL